MADETREYSGCETAVKGDSVAASGPKPSSANCLVIHEFWPRTPWNRPCDWSAPPAGRELQLWSAGRRSAGPRCQPSARCKRIPMTRRRFVFWVGFGMFGLAAKLRWDGLDKWAAAMMRANEPMLPTGATEAAPAVTPVHWTVAGDATWQWYEREHLIDGRWTLTGKTAPTHHQTGEREDAGSDYLDDSFVPPEMKFVHSHRNESAVRRMLDFGNHRPSSDRKGRHGRPPSEWLRSLYADEIRIWLRSIEVPDAGVSGMTVWTHLTRDHSFDPLRIAGLTEPEQFKLHAAAHYGY